MVKIRMARLLLILSLIIFSLACSTSNDAYNYIKVISVIRAESITDYNKGFALGDYFYYEPKTDSIAFRLLQSRDPFRFSTYQGKLRNKAYADTIAMLIPFLKKINAKHIDTLKHCYQPNCCCTPDYYVEYNNARGSEFFFLPEIDNDTSRSFLDFVYQLKETSFEKE